MVFYLCYPSLYTGKGGPVRDGIGEDNASGALIVSLGDVLEAFLACCVPDLQLVLAIAYGHGLDFEVHSNGGNVGVLEAILAEAGDKVSLAHATVSDYYNFRHVVIAIVLLRFLHAINY